MSKKSKKKIWLALTALVLVAACVAAWMLIPRTPQEEVFVYGFNMVGYTSFYNGGTESYGMVTTDRVQTVYVTPTQSITEILVYQGQEVKKGDVLCRYDTTLSDMELERKDLSIQQLEVNLKTAQAELKSLKAMKPMVLPDKTDEDEDKNKTNKSPADEAMVGKIYNADTAKGTSSRTAFRVWLKSSTQVTNEMIKEYLAARDPSMTKEVYVVFGIAAKANSEYTQEYGVRYKLTTFKTEADNVNGADQLSARSEPEFQLVFLNNTEPSSEPTEPTSEPTEPSSEPTEPSSEPTEPTSEPTEPSSEPTEPSSEPTEPSSEPTEPSSEPTESSSEPTEPTTEPTEPECPHEDLAYHYIDTNHEILCLTCKETVGTEVCVDDDADHKCDLCGGCSQHICAPKDLGNGSHGYVCRFCGRDDLIGTERHMDANEDGYCDVCDFNDPKEELVTVESISMRFFVPTATTQKDDDDIIWNSGYTSSELVSMREAKQKEIDELKYSIKMGKAELKIMEQEADDGEITAEFDGVVNSILEPENALALNAPMIKVTGGGGFYVEGSVSELDLATIQIGQQVTVTSWETYSTYQGTITEIGSYPADDDMNYYGETNVSYYPYKVFIDESADLQEGFYVSMTYETQTQEEGIMYLENAFMRNENGAYYVYVRNDAGLLEKRFITVGDNDGYMTQILSGLSETDCIAFPYGNAVKEGAPTVEGTWDDLYGY